MPASKRAMTLAKLETFQSLSEQGLLPDERLKAAISEAQEKGDLPRSLPISAFEEKSTKVLEFAQRFGLVHEGKAPRNGQSEPSYADLIRAQHPATVSQLDAVDSLRKQTFKVKDADGSVRDIKFMPFYRDITPKPEGAASPASPSRRAEV